jgi:hypothetical protein
MQVQAHQPMKPPPGRHHGEWLNISALDLSRSFSHLPLSDDSTSVWAERDRAAATSFEIDNSHTKIVWIFQNLYF